MNTDPLWKISASSPIEWASWGDNAVVYNIGSGDTHLLEATTVEVYLALEQTPSTATQLSQEIKPLFEDIETHALIQHIQNVLWHLDDIGLIEPDTL